MVQARLRLKQDFNKLQLETGDFCLGYDRIDLLFNAGPYPGGGDCLVVKADGELTYLDSNDLIHDLDAYTIEQPELSPQVPVMSAPVSTDDDIGAQFLGYVILFELFDGDPDKWIRHLRTEGSKEQQDHDLPFALWVKEQSERDPELLSRARHMVIEARHSFFMSSERNRD